MMDEESDASEGSSFTGSVSSETTSSCAGQDEGTAPRLPSSPSRIVDQAVSAGHSYDLRKRRAPPRMDEESAGDSDEDRMHLGQETAELQATAAIKPDKVRKLSWDSRLCHGEGLGSLKSTDTLRPFMPQTWETLHKAAEVRRDSTYFFLLEERTVNEDGSLCPPRGVYHRSCYSSYTSKSNIEYASRVMSASAASSRSISPTGLAPTPVGSQSAEGGRERLSRSKLAATDFSKCIFCQDRKRMPKHRWKDESLVKCATIDASLRIKEAAKVLQVERLLLAVQEEADLIALDVVYHKSCYRSKTRQKTIDRLAKQASEKACAHVD